jgi:hypothetical protein
MRRLRIDPYERLVHVGEDKPDIPECRNIRFRYRVSVGNRVEF